MAQDRRTGVCVAAKTRLFDGGPHRLEKSHQSEKKNLVIGANRRIYRFAQIARACGRVSVGGDPDKRPEKRRNLTGSRRRTGELRLCGGSRLKATTDRAFSSLSALQSRLTEEASLSCRACGKGIPLPIDGCSNVVALFAQQRQQSTAHHRTVLRESARRSWIVDISTFVAFPPRASETCLQSAEAFLTSARWNTRPS